MLFHQVKRSRALRRISSHTLLNTNGNLDLQVRRRSARFTLSRLYPHGCVYIWSRRLLEHTSRVRLVAQVPKHAARDYANMQHRCFPNHLDKLCVAHRLRLPRRLPLQSNVPTASRPGHERLGALVPLVACFLEQGSAQSRKTVISAKVSSSSFVMGWFRGTSQMPGARRFLVLPVDSRNKASLDLGPEPLTSRSCTWRPRPSSRKCRIIPHHLPALMACSRICGTSGRVRYPAQRTPTPCACPRSRRYAICSSAISCTS